MPDKETGDLVLGGHQRVTAGEDITIEGVPHRLVFVSHGNTDLDYRANALRFALDNNARRFRGRDEENVDLAGEVIDDAKRFLDFLEGEVIR